MPSDPTPDRVDADAPPATVADLAARYDAAARALMAPTPEQRAEWKRLPSEFDALVDEAPLDFVGTGGCFRLAEKEEAEWRAGVSQWRSRLCDALSALERCEAERDRLREVLRRVEWDGETLHEGDLVSGCLLCGAPWPAIGGGEHKSNCALAAALEGL